MCSEHLLTEKIFVFLQCSFRHCLAARETDVVCEKWIQKKCTDISCCKRHPKLIKQQSGTKKNRNYVLVITCKGRKYLHTECIKYDAVCYVTQYLSHNRTICHVFPSNIVYYVIHRRKPNRSWTAVLFFFSFPCINV